MQTRLIGGHVSASGGYHNALHKLKEIGGNTMQIFSTSPKFWGKGEISDEKINPYLELNKEHQVKSVYFHATYLINMADDGKTGQASVTALASELALAKRMGVIGSVVHLGSFKDKMEGNIEMLSNHDKYAVLIQNIKSVLEKIPDDRLFLIENAGNRKIGQTLNEIGKIIGDIKDPRLKVCLDTCHLHAAGYDLSAPEKLEAFIAEFDSLIGLERLELWHMNDSRDPFGSLRDRHENIGKGMVGIDVFKNILNHPKLKHLAFILEVPGENKEGPNKENVDILKSLVK